MSTQGTIDDAWELLHELERRIEELNEKFSVIKDILRIIARLQEKILIVLQSINKKLDEHSRKLDEHSRKLDKHSKKLDEHTQILNEHTRILNDHTKRLDRIEREIRDLRVSIRRVTYDIEKEALEIVPLYLERFFNKLIRVRRFEIKGKLEINIYGEYGDMVIIGECKNRIGPSGILEVLGKALALSKHKDLKIRKILLVLYGIDYVDLVKDIAEKHNVAIITPRGLITPIKLTEISKIKKSYEELRKKLYSEL